MFLHYFDRTFDGPGACHPGLFAPKRIPGNWKLMMEKTSRIPTTRGCYTRGSSPSGLWRADKQVGSSSWTRTVATRA